MSRTDEPKSYRIAAAIRDAIAAVRRDRYPTQWLTTVYTCEVGVTLAAAKAQRPVVFVEAVSADNTPQMLPHHEASESFTITMQSENEADPELGIQRLMADVKRAVGMAGELNGLVKALDITGWDKGTELHETLGLGQGTISVRATYEWSHEDP